MFLNRYAYRSFPVKHDAVICIYGKDLIPDVEIEEVDGEQLTVPEVVTAVRNKFYNKLWIKLKSEDSGMFKLRSVQQDAFEFIINVNRPDRPSYAVQNSGSFKADLGYDYKAGWVSFAYLPESTLVCVGAILIRFLKLLKNNILRRCLLK